MNKKNPSYIFDEDMVESAIKFIVIKEIVKLPDMDNDTKIGAIKKLIEEI